MTIFGSVCIIIIINFVFKIFSTVEFSKDEPTNHNIDP